jgi:hypothetical protein
MNKSLRTWRLTPISNNSDLWVLSNHRGEVWVRAHDAREARSLTAERFRVRVRIDDGRSGMESPWYMRELSRCEVDPDPRFDSIEMPCVLYPAPNRRPVANAPFGEPRTEICVLDTSAGSDPTSPDVVALDIRRAIVALLLAKKIDVPGRWLDVYVAEEGADNRTSYNIIPTRKLKGLIAEELSPLLGRTLNREEASWVVYGEEVHYLLRGGDAKLSMSKVA